MTTSVVSLADKTRDLLDDYGDANTTLTSAVTDTTGTTFAVASVSEMDAGDWLSVDFETVYFVSTATLNTTVRRGQRGSTAATHASGAVVLVSPLYPGNRILSALNGALGKLTKVVKDVATLTVTADTYTYDKPSTIDEIKRVEIENSKLNSEFNVMRDWEMLDGTHFRIFGDYSTDRNIGVVGTSKFTALATTGNMDTDFPDTNANAINFLIYEAAGQLLLQRQAKIASRDSFEGITDSFGQNFPDLSVKVARQYLAEAERYRQLAVRQCAILRTPVVPTQNPGRTYHSRY
jgi:hypothetical protein